MPHNDRVGTAHHHLSRATQMGTDVCVGSGEAGG